ncbi:MULTISPECIES: hypothetical protein [unclassified Streptomyces]|uniref:hypothetical protein n=1 Tax=unclassified Streptomyces TaxID=2593676 RepID=UPI001661BE5A|nr:MULTISPECIES: hypothetical protein [unclassified Streptomyces]MBD0840281.1 hypothetical protein [Streptomyces sp. TRM68416]
MRIRATVAAVSGALVLSAFAVPAAQADDSGSAYRADVAKARIAQGTRADAPYDLDVTFSDFKVAKAIKVGTTGHVARTVTYTMTHGADVKIKARDFVTGPYLYKGAYTGPDGMLFGDKPATCTSTSPTTATCTGKIDIYPGDRELVNSDAGTWKGAALALAQNGQDPDGVDYDITKVGYADQGGLGSTVLQRNSKLTVDASPEPVKKGKTLTVTGKLSRANWETRKYAGYAGQPVTLQFRKKGSSAYTNVKGIKSNAKGELKTTVKASQDGYYRFVFKGTKTTPAVTAAGDFVDVQ